MNKLIAKDDLHANGSGDYQRLPPLKGEQHWLKSHGSIIYEFLDAHTRI